MAQKRNSVVSTNMLKRTSNPGLVKVTNSKNKGMVTPSEKSGRIGLAVNEDGEELEVEEETNYDDMTSVDLSEEEDKEENLTDEQLLDILAAKHRFNDDAKIIHVAIIDYLTRYGCLKAVEKHVKSYQAPEGITTVSVADPLFYGDRFQRFMLENVLADTDD